MPAAQTAMWSHVNYTHVMNSARRPPGEQPVDGSLGEERAHDVAHEHQGERGSGVPEECEVLDERCAELHCAADGASCH